MVNETAPAAGSGGRAAGLTMPQAVVISVVMTVVFVMAVVLRLGGMAAGEVFQLLGGAGGIGTVLVLAVMPGGRGAVAAVVRAASQSGR
ncbi:hypothetical protein [Streptomyces goshikiensis]|uniref:hypothetical protein n=1 Tax=Streptomyces goshikiensis TaxID=1942 RepID=UPI0036798044